MHDSMHSHAPKWHCLPALLATQQMTHFHGDSSISMIGWLREHLQGVPQQEPFANHYSGLTSVMYVSIEVRGSRGDIRSTMKNAPCGENPHLNIM